MIIKAIVNRFQLRMLMAKLSSLPKKIQRKFIREETRKAAKTHLLKQAKAAAPKETGALRRAIRIVAIKKSRVFVGVRLALSAKWFTGDTFYGAFQEWGWRHGKRSNALTAAANLRSRRNKSRAAYSLLGMLIPERLKKRKRTIKAEKAAEAAIAGDKRRKIPGRFFLRSISRTQGPIAVTAAQKGIAHRVEMELRK